MKLVLLAALAASILVPSVGAIAAQFNWDGSKNPDPNIELAASAPNTAAVAPPGTVAPDPEIEALNGKICRGWFKYPYSSWEPYRGAVWLEPRAMGRSEYWNNNGNVALEKWQSPTRQHYTYLGTVQIRRRAEDQKLIFYTPRGSTVELVPLGNFVFKSLVIQPDQSTMTPGEYHCSDK